MMMLMIFSTSNGAHKSTNRPTSVCFVFAGASLDRFNDNLIRDLLLLPTFLASSGYPLGPTAREKLLKLTQISNISIALKVGDFSLGGNC